MSYRHDLNAPGAAIERIREHLRAWKRGDSPEMLHRLCAFWLRCHAGAWWIRDEHEQVIPLRPNQAQTILTAAMMDQAAEGRPIRLRLLKSRKHGASTWVQVLFADLCAHQANQRAVTVAHEAEATREIFTIARRAAENFGIAPDPPSQASIRWPQTGSIYTCQTAGATAVSAGGTPNLMHHSEKPKWLSHKQEETHYNTLNAVPYTPTSIVIDESTAHGRELFWKGWEAAHAKDGLYDALFLPWYIDRRLERPVPADFARTDTEAALAGSVHGEGYELSDGQLQWRRDKIGEIGLPAFRQEFPSSPEEAIQAREGLILPGLRRWLCDELPFDPKAVGTDCIVGGIDFGYADPTVVWTGVWWQGELWLVDYYRRVEGLAHDHAEAISPYGRYYCDPANVSDRQQLQRECERLQLRARFFTAPRHKRPGEDVSATELKTLIRFVEQGRLHILRELSEQVIVEADTFAWNERTGKADERRSADCGHYDSIMALKYLVMGLAPTLDRRVTTTAVRPMRSRYQQCARW